MHQIGRVSVFSVEPPMNKSESSKNSPPSPPGGVLSYLVRIMIYVSMCIIIIAG